MLPASLVLVLEGPVELWPFCSFLLFLYGEGNNTIGTRRLLLPVLFKVVQKFRYVIKNLATPAQSLWSNSDILQHSVNENCINTCNDLLRGQQYFWEESKGRTFLGTPQKHQ